VVRGPVDEVRNDRVRAALQRHEPVEGITVAATHLAGDDGGLDGVFGLPVRGLDVGAAHADEERRPLGPQVPQEAPVRGMGDSAGERAIGVRLQAVERDAEPAALEFATLTPLAQRQCAQEQPAHRVGGARRPALRRLEQEVAATQEAREAGLVRVACGSLR